jgi:hypothetical protein
VPPTAAGEGLAMSRLSSHRISIGETISTASPGTTPGQHTPAGLSPRAPFAAAGAGSSSSSSRKQQGCSCCVGWAAICEGAFDEMAESERQPTRCCCCCFYCC